MDDPTAIDQSAESKQRCGEALRRSTDYIAGKHHVVAQLGSLELHYGSVALRVLMVTVCLVSLPTYYPHPETVELISNHTTRPLGCMSWLVVATMLVLLMKESIEIYDGFDRKLEYNIWSLWCIPYSFTPSVAPPQQLMLLSPVSTNGSIKRSGSMMDPLHSPGSDRTNHPLMQRPGMPGRHLNRSDTVMTYTGNYIRICITMPSNFGLQSWRWYEAIVESMAVGLYLYATFVLTSTVFLNADRAMIYSTITTLCLIATRVLGTLF
jgi:hypothetical protein